MFYLSETLKKNLENLENLFIVYTFCCRLYMKVLIKNKKNSVEKEYHSYLLLIFESGNVYKVEEINFVV